MGGNGRKGLGPAVLRLIGVGAHILQPGIHALLCEVDAVLFHITAFGIAVAAFQLLAGVEEFIPPLPGQVHQGFVEAVDGLHGDVRVAAGLGHRRHRADDDIGVGPGFLNGVQRFAVPIDEGVRALIGVVGAEGDDDTFGLHQADGFGHIHVAISLELHTGRSGNVLHAHADDAQVVLPGGLAEGHHAGAVGIADKQGLVDIAFAGVVGLGQNGAAVGGLVQLALGLVVIRFHHADGAGRAVHDIHTAGRDGTAAGRQRDDQNGRQHQYQQAGAGQNGDVQHAARAHPLPKTSQRLTQLTPLSFELFHRIPPEIFCPYKGKS